MKIFLPVVLCILSASRISFAQYDNANLLVQSPDGKLVKLVWFVKSWNPEITGFDIKRKEGLEDWVKLNTEPILPAISVKKNLLIVEPDKTEASRINAQLVKLVKDKKVEEMDNATYLRKLNENDRTLRELSAAFSYDYDLALMNGFAFVDHTVSNKSEYEYGLFIQGTDKLLDSVLWDYGQIPDLNVITDITSRSLPGTDGIELRWNADINRMRAGYVAGFNVYREGIRVNDSLVTGANNKDPQEFIWYSKSANGSKPHQYSISAESVLGIEGIIKPYVYNPAEHRYEYKKTEVGDVTSLGYYFKDGINVTWSMPRESERYLRGFYIEKDNIPHGYTRVSPLLSPSTRQFIDKTASPISGYIKFRVVTVYNDKSEITGPDKLYNYFPLTDPPQPQHARARGGFEQGKYVIHFSWDPKIKGDTLTDHYQVYLYDWVKKRPAPLSDKKIMSESYSYTAPPGTAAIYEFGVTAISKLNTESMLSDTIKVAVPSMELPSPVISKAQADGGRVTIAWEYPGIADLKGFRLFLGGRMIAGENEIGKSIREFRTGVLQQGTICEFTIKAVSESGVEGVASSAMSVSIPNESKK